jgi:hypothetical protein
MPGTPLTRALGRAGARSPDPRTEVPDLDDTWQDVAPVADRDVVRFSDRQIETMLVAAAVGVIGAAVFVGWMSLRRRRA